MAAAAPQSQSQPLSAEEEALKRNTDCVYFLASPLTCKKVFSRAPFSFNRHCSFVVLCLWVCFAL